MFELAAVGDLIFSFAALEVYQSGISEGIKPHSSEQLLPAPNCGSIFQLASVDVCSHKEHLKFLLCLACG